MPDRRENGGAPPGHATVLISANTFWNIVNFRTGLIHALLRHGFRVVLAAPDGDLKWAAENRVEIEAVAIDRSGVDPIRDALLILTYHKLIRSIRPNIFLGYTAKPNIYGTVAARLCGVPALPNVSGLGTAFIVPGWLSTLVGTLYRIAFRNCPIVFFQNADDRDLFVARKIVGPEQARLLAGSGVDLGHFMPAPRATEIRFLFVGRLLGDKGVREFVEAARLLRTDHPDWQFQLLGPLDEGNRTAISRVELNRWVTDAVVEYLGPAEDVRPFIASATAVVLPSYREGLPRSLLEAAAMARPLIATDVPGNRQVVEHGINGLLCAVRNPASLARAMEQLAMMDGAERDAMGKAGRERVEREYSEEKVIAAYLDAIAQLHPARESWA